MYISAGSKLTEMKEQTVLYEDRRRRAVGYKRKNEQSDNDCFFFLLFQLLKDQRALAVKVFESRQVIRTTRRLAKKLRLYKHMEVLLNFSS